MAILMLIGCSLDNFVGLSDVKTDQYTTDLYVFIRFSAQPPYDMLTFYFCYFFFQKFYNRFIRFNVQPKL